MKSDTELLPNRILQGRWPRPTCDYCDEPAAFIRETYNDSGGFMEELLCRRHRDIP